MINVTRLLVVDELSARLGSDSFPTIFFRAFYFHWDRLFVFDQLK